MLVTAGLLAAGAQHDAAAAQAVVPAPIHSALIQLAQAEPTAGDIAEYRRRLGIYLAARAQFESVAEPYWKAIADKRRLRFAKRHRREPIGLADYVRTQPPLYAGPPRPVDPTKEEQPREGRPIPVAADFIRDAVEQFRFMPEQPKSELDYKRAYARVAAAAGLTRDQIVRVYSFESGGNGRYDVQAGLESKRPNARAISTALGYNQLLNANSVELMAEKGDTILHALRAKAQAASGPRRAALEAKLAVVSRMVAFCRSVPDTWSRHVRLGNTAKGLGVHAMSLDIDVGPLLQTHKLTTSVIFARRKGYTVPLTAAELEMMNLTGDGNGFDMVLMPAALREQVPTANFFQRSGYERNPVAIRNNTVSKLLAATNARMDRETALPGARDLAAAYPR